MIAKNPVIYLAIGYTPKTKNKFLASLHREASFNLVNEIAAKLMQKGYTVFSPISHSHPISKRLTEKQNSFKFWISQDVHFMKMCRYLYVCLDSNWKESKGVQKEIEIARALGMEIYGVKIRKGKLEFKIIE